MAPAPQGRGVHLGGNRVIRQEGGGESLLIHQTNVTGPGLHSPATKTQRILQEFFGIIGRLLDSTQDMVHSSQSGTSVQKVRCY